MISGVLARFSLQWALTYTGVVLLVAMLLNLSTSFVQFGYSVTLPAIEETLHLSHTRAGVLVTMVGAARMFSALLAGTLAPRYGHRIIIGLSALAMGGSMALLGFSGSYLLAVLAAGLMGFSNGGAITPMMGLLAAWFGVRDRGLAAGLAATGGSFGFILVGIAAPLFIAGQTDTGWRITWQLFGLMTLVFGVAALIFVRERPATPPDGAAASIPPSPAATAPAAASPPGGATTPIDANQPGGATTPAAIPQSGAANPAAAIPQSGAAHPAASPQSGAAIPAANPQSGAAYPAASPQSGAAHPAAKPQSGAANPAASSQSEAGTPSAATPQSEAATSSAATPQSGATHPAAVPPPSGAAHPPAAIPQSGATHPAAANPQSGATHPATTTPPPAAPARPAGAAPLRSWPMEVYKNPAVWLVSFMAFCTGWGQGIFGAFFGLYLSQEHGISLGVVGQLVILIGVLSVVSGIMWGRLSDRIGRGSAFVISFLMQGVAFVMFAFFPGLAMFIAASALVGVTQRAGYTICAASSGDYVPPQYAATAFGIIAVMASLGGSISPTLGGLTADYIDMQWSFVLGLAGLLAGAAGGAALHWWKPARAG